MSYIIFDLEWNQPTNTGRSKELPHGEIIQIGFIKTDEELGMLSRDEITVKPVIYRIMNPYVSTLTGITQAEINAGLDFPDAIERMISSLDEDTVLITWGDDDLPVLRENMMFHGMDPDELPDHYNLQRIYAAQTKTPQRQIGLKTALEGLGITDEIKAHDALNDAYMTYLIARKLDIADGIAQYSKLSRKSTVKAALPWDALTPVCTANLAVSIKPSSLADYCRRIHICCPVCGGELNNGHLIRHGKLSFIAKSGCPDHPSLFIRYEYKKDTICVSCFDMNETLERIYNNRIRIREKSLKQREARRHITKHTRTDKSD